MTCDVPTKFQQEQNIFFLLAAPDATYSRQIDDLTKFEIGDCMKDLKAKVYARSCFGMKALTAIFQAVDTKGDHNLECDDFRWGLIDYGIQLSKEDSVELSAHFGSNGCVNYAQFLTALKVSFSFILF